VKVPFTRRFGFEFECLRAGITRPQLHAAILTVPGQTATVNGYGHQNNNSEWVVKTDASCGWEVASRVMSTAADLYVGADVVSAMQRAGASVNNSCGFHVHVEVADFDMDQVATMIQWWVKFERFISDVLDPSRKHNSYCTRASCNFTGDMAYTTATTLRNNGGRGALNTAIIDWSSNPDSGYRRVEFRIAQGTNNFVDVKNWIRYLLTFVEFTKTAPRPENVNHLLPQKVLETLGLLADGISNGMVEMRTWLLDSALKNAQDELDRKLIKHVQNQLGDD